MKIEFNSEIEKECRAFGIILGYDKPSKEFGFGLWLWTLQLSLTISKNQK